jgi:hypothetical protein
MRIEHPFWALLTAATLVWYSVVTLYVAIRGVRDIRDMTRRLTRSRGDPSGRGAADSGRPKG